MPKKSDDGGSTAPADSSTPVRLKVATIRAPPQQPRAGVEQPLPVAAGHRPSSYSQSGPPTGRRPARVAAAPMTGPKGAADLQLAHGGVSHLRPSRRRRSRSPPR